MVKALLTIVALSTSLVALIAVRVLWTSRRVSATEAHKLYQDKDGVATEESQKHYFYFVRIAKFLLLAIWAVGLSVSLGASVSRTTVAGSAPIVESWLTFAAWVGRSIRTYARDMADDNIRVASPYRFSSLCSNADPSTYSVQRLPML